MLKKVRQTLKRHSLLKPDTTVVAGVSGGADSMALLDVLTFVARQKNIKLVVAHVRYSIRGAEAEADRRRVSKQAAAYGWKFVCEDLSDRKHSTAENWLRQKRYEFFEKVRQEYSAAAVAVGHTRDDLTETFFLHLLRGSGLRGLRGMRYRNGHVVRPLLDVTHGETLAYCRRKKIPFADDRTNFDQKYLRNRIRHSLLPFLRENFNPRIDSSIASLTHILADDYACLSELTQKSLPAYELSVEKKTGRKVLSFAAADLNRLPPALRRMALFRLVSIVTDRNQPPLSFARCEQMLEIIASDKSKEHIFKSRDLILRRKGAIVSLVVAPRQ